MNFDRETFLTFPSLNKQGYETFKGYNLPLLAASLKNYLKPETSCEKTRAPTNENQAEKMPDSPSEIIELFKKQINDINLDKMEQNKENELILNFYILCKGHLTEKGSQLLSTYASKGYLTFVSKLLDANASVNVSDEFGNTPLISALVFEESYFLAHILGLKDAHVFSNDKKLSKIFCPITGLESKNQTLAIIGIVNTLIAKGANVNAENNSGNTPLMYATHIRNFEMAHTLVDILIAKGANVNAENNSGNTPLIIEILQILEAASLKASQKNEN